MHDELAHYIHTTNAYADSLRAMAVCVQREALARMNLTNDLRNNDRQSGDLVRAFYKAQREVGEAHGTCEFRRTEMMDASVALLRVMEVKE
jgi:hypothetical protein